MLSFFLCIFFLQRSLLSLPPPPPPPPPSASRHTTQLHGIDITFNHQSQVTSPTHGRQSTYSLIMQMDFAGLATRFQEAITARDAAGQVSDLQLVPLLRAISLDLKHLLRDIRQRQRPTPAATPRVAPAAAPALILTPTFPATLEGSPIGEPLFTHRSVSPLLVDMHHFTATCCFSLLH